MDNFNELYNQIISEANGQEPSKDQLEKEIGTLGDAVSNDKNKETDKEKIRVLLEEFIEKYGDYEIYDMIHDITSINKKQNGFDDIDGSDEYDGCNQNEFDSETSSSKTREREEYDKLNAEFQAKQRERIRKLEEEEENDPKHKTEKKAREEENKKAKEAHDRAMYMRGW